MALFHEADESVSSSSASELFGDDRDANHYETDDDGMDDDTGDDETEAEVEEGQDGEWCDTFGGIPYPMEADLTVCARFRWQAVCR